MPDKHEQARRLAEAHYELESAITGIYRLTSSAGSEANEPIKLLEVNEETVATGVMPLHFAPAPSRGIDFATIIVELTPEEFDRVLNDDLPLPHGWMVGECIPRTNGAPAG